MVVITTHTNADFDSLASMVAASRLHPGAILVFSGASEALLRRYIEEHAAGLPKIVPLKGLDLDTVVRLVCVDVSSRERIGPFSDLVDRCPAVAIEVFDHHPGHGDLCGEIGEVEEAGACTSVMVKILVKAGHTPTSSEATLFLLGIYEDTGFLSYPTTRPADFEAVLTCLAWGADLGQVPRILRRGLSKAHASLLPALLESLESVSVGGVRVHLAAVETEAYIPDLSLLVHEILALENLEALFLLAAMEGRVHIIARSRSPLVDAAKALSVFGGGGHPSAASAVVRGRTPEEVRILLLEDLTTGHPVGLRARDIMTAQFRRIEAAAVASEAFTQMNRSRVNALPVFAQGRLAGVVTRQEVDGAIHHGLGNSPVTDFVVSTPPLLSPDTPAEEIRRLMLERNWRIVLLGDSPEKVEGLISRMSLFKHLYRSAGEGSRAKGGGQPAAGEVAQLLFSAFPAEEANRMRALGRMGVEKGAECLLVGGAVRDLLLGRPVQDIDFVVEGDAVELCRAWAAVHGGRVRAHQEFGTAVWIKPGGGHWDFATARAEFYESPAALPTVAHAALSQDLYRRDFTINSIAMALSPDRFGEILDLFGGVRDLKAGRIRALQGLSFVEDPTRAFRAVRFGVRLGFALPPETELLIAAAHKQGVFRHLSAKRVLAEVEQILDGQCAVEGLKAMEAHGLLQVFEPKLNLTPRLLDLLYRIQRAVDFFETQFPGTPIDRPCLYLMALAERLKADDLELFARSHPFSKKTRDILLSYRSKTWHLLREIGGECAPSPGALYLELAGQPLHWILYALAKVDGASAKGAIRDFLVRDRFVRLTITGGDLTSAGVPPSSAVARALDATRAAKVEGRLVSREEELAFALNAARRQADTAPERSRE